MIFQDVGLVSVKCNITLPAGSVSVARRGDFCPQLVRAWHVKKISCIQFLRGERVRVTVREPAFREELLSSDFVFEVRFVCFW